MAGVVRVMDATVMPEAVLRVSEVSRRMPS